MAITSTQKNKLVILSLLILFFIFIRIMIISCSEILIRQGEEPYVGTIAKGILEGWISSVWDYQRIPYVGGHVMAAYLALPFFILFGFKQIALVTAAIIIGLTGLVFLYILCEKYFNRRVAVISCVLYILPPPLLMVRSLIFNGSHSESVVFTILVFFVFLNTLYNKRSVLNYSILGLLSGISFSYLYTNAISILTCLFIWITIKRKVFLKKEFIFYISGLTLGCTPWLSYNFRNNFSGLEFVATNFSGVSNHALKEFPSVLFESIKNMRKMFIFDHFSIVSGNIFNIIYYSIFLISLFFILFLIIKKLILSYQLKSKINFQDKCPAYSKYLFIGTFIIIYILVYSISNIKFKNSGNPIMDYKYGLIIFPYIFISIALFIDGLFSARNPLCKFAGLVMLATATIIGFVGNSGLFYSLDFKNKYLGTTAIYYDLVGRVAADKYDIDWAKAEKFIRRVKSGCAVRNAVEGYGFALGDRFSREMVFNEKLGLLKNISMPADILGSFWRGIGKARVDNYYQERMRNVHKDNFKIVDFIAECNQLHIPAPQRDYFYAGVIEQLLAERWNEQFSRLDIKIDDLANILPEEYRYLTYLFYGFSVGDKIARKDHFYDSLRLPPDLNSNYLRYYYMGVGTTVTYFFSGNIRKSINFLNSFEKTIRDYLLTGVGLYFYIFNDCSKDSRGAGYPHVFLKEYNVYYEKAASLFKDTPLNSFDFQIGN
ncbi:MAG: glycosyltransferase family 39 protein [Candidatus Omnitrophica bacterium]|nr:glycosyltransferase family 39 protein [Candidatus Omnitrophota bacterium]MDD5690556.1 glycosyltransferase family 39 protein [Candidatus Omnitrophota bacterium]